jgi:hypothetical protein
VVLRSSHFLQLKVGKHLCSVLRQTCQEVVYLCTILVEEWKKEEWKSGRVEKEEGRVEEGRVEERRGITYLNKNIIEQINAGFLVGDIADALNLYLSFDLVSLSIGVRHHVEQVQLPILGLDGVPELLPLIHVTFLGTHGDGSNGGLLHHVDTNVVVVIGRHIERGELLLVYSRHNHARIVGDEARLEVFATLVDIFGEVSGLGGLPDEVLDRREVLLRHERGKAIG